MAVSSWSRWMIASSPRTPPARQPAGSAGSVTSGGPGGPRRSRHARGAGTTRRQSAPGREAAEGPARSRPAPAGSHPRRDRCRAGSCATRRGTSSRGRRRAARRLPGRRAGPASRLEVHAPHPQRGGGPSRATPCNCRIMKMRRMGGGLRNSDRPLGIDRPRMRVELDCEPIRPTRSPTKGSAARLVEVGQGDEHENDSDDREDRGDRQGGAVPGHGLDREDGELEQCAGALTIPESTPATTCAMPRTSDRPSRMMNTP